MRILLIGEYSNVHATLAEGLRELGHEVVVASNGDFWKDYPRDIDLARPAGRLGGLRLLWRLLRALPRLRGYDVVQLINPMFVELKAKRIFPLYRWLRSHNKRMVLGAFGMDWYWVHTCSTRSSLRYSDFNFGPQQRHDPAAERERRDWLGTDKERLNRMIAADCDTIVAGLYEYWACYQPAFPDKTVFVPYPIRIRNEELEVRSEELEVRSDMSCCQQSNPLPTTQSSLPASSPRPLVLFIGISRGRSKYKGTDIMLQAAKDVAAKYPGRIELRVAEGVPFSQYIEIMSGADAILDQLYSYTPSMNPLAAMAKGIVCIGGGEPENYEILGETQLRPIVNVQPYYNSVFHEIERLVLNPERLPELKWQSIEYIRRHHDHKKVAQEWLDKVAGVEAQSS